MKRARSPTASSSFIGDGFTRGFEELAVLDARRTDALACAAAEAAFDVARERARLYGQSPLFDGAHQIDSAARAVVLVARVDVCRAGFEAQAAMDAREELLLLRGQRTRQLCEALRHKSDRVKKCRTDRVAPSRATSKTRTTPSSPMRQTRASTRPARVRQLTSRPQRAPP